MLVRAFKLDITLGATFAAGEVTVRVTLPLGRLLRVVFLNSALKLFLFFQRVGKQRNLREKIHHSQVRRQRICKEN